MKKAFTVIDFDGTLANTPIKPQGWIGRDWWGNKVSLVSPSEGGFWNGSVNQAVVEAFQKASADPDTDAILLTGRRSPVAQYVRTILRKFDLYGIRVIDQSKKKEQEWFHRIIKDGGDFLDENCSHEQYFVGDIEVTNKVPGTFGHKKEVIERLVGRAGGYEIVDIWDDRKDHIGLFIDTIQGLMKRGLVNRAIIHQVYAPVAEDCEATIVEIPITDRTSWKTHG